jgi:hypothetical protein
MLHPNLSPSRETEIILRAAGWRPELEVDTSIWVEKLGEDGNAVFPVAETILRKFGSLRFIGPRARRQVRHDFQMNPLSWLGERDRLDGIEEITGSRACPLGETSGAAMLAVLEDGRVVADLDGWIIQLGRSWSEALDHLILGTGETMLLAEDYDKPVDPPRPWNP